jgi:hypothetical protein
VTRVTDIQVTDTPVQDTSKKQFPPKLSDAERSVIAKIVGSMYHEELHGGQRLVYMLLVLMSGEPIDTQEFADRLGMSRQNVYRMLRELSEMRVPVTNYPAGRWTLLDLIPEDEEPIPPSNRKLKPKEQNPHEPK